MEQRDEVWAETTDGGLLRQLFGYYPTLHDARIRSIAFDPRKDLAELLVDYRDLVEGQPSNSQLNVRIKLTWTKVKRFDLSLGANDIGSMSMRRQGDLIRTEIESGYGVNGFIESEQFEAVLDKLDPLPDDEEEDRFSIRYR